VSRIEQRGRELRYQLAALIREFPDRVRSAFRPEWSPVYDVADGDADCGTCRYRDYSVPVPALRGAGSDGHVAGDGDDDAPPSPALHLMLPCRRELGGCGARTGAPCVTRFGYVASRPHKARREAAERATVIEAAP